MSFYRTYRPQIIEAIDSSSVRTQLHSLLGKNASELPHAFLLTGPRGIGKTTSARIIAKIFVCQKPTKHGPCGSCDACKAIQNGTYIDLLEIDAASNRGIDEIRTLRESIATSPAIGSYKIYLIDEVHMLTSEAFNALLKTLEEPPKHAVFILATTELQKVPITVQSRCLVLTFVKATPSELLGALEKITKDQKITLPTEVLSYITKLADGSYRDAVKLLEQISLLPEPITLAGVERILHGATNVSIETLHSQLEQQALYEAIQTIDTLQSQSVNWKYIISDLSSFAETKLTYAISKNDQQSRDLQLSIIRMLLKAWGDLRIAPFPHLALKLAVVEFCAAKKQETPKIEQSQPQTSPHQAGRPQEEVVVEADTPPKKTVQGILTIEKLTLHYRDFIDDVKRENSTLAGFLRSTRPKSIDNGIVWIETTYQLHKDKLAEIKAKDILVSSLKKLFGEKLKIEIVLTKKS